MSLDASAWHRACYLEFRMITPRSILKAVLVATCLSLAAACDGGGPSRNADEIAADSALAADLALANRDTLLVDSIGEYRPADAAELDAQFDTLTGDLIDPVPSAPVVRAPSAPATAAPRPSAPSTSRPNPAPSVTTPTPAPAATRPPAAAKPAATAPRLTGMRACNSPGLENQSECVRLGLASADQRLNRIYRALITEMRRQEGVPGGAKDPPSVQRLRVAQRAWLVHRDNECRRRGRGREGALWARPRVRCLGQFSGRRANELADNFSRLTAP